MKEKPELLQQVADITQHLKYFHILCGIYVAAMFTSLTISARLLPFHIPFTDVSILLTAGTWTIPLSFFIQDIVTEVYGYARSRQLLQLAVILLVFYVLYVWATTLFPVPTVNNIDAAYNEIFKALPRHLFALLTALFVGNIINSYLLSKLKIYFRGKYLAWRFIASTMVGEAALQVAGTTIAWFHNLNFTNEILPFVVFSYSYKVFFECILTPINVVASNYLKKVEGIDVYDTDTNYNPFVWKIG